MRGLVASGQLDGGGELIAMWLIKNSYMQTILREMGRNLIRMSTGVASDLLLFSVIST